MKALTLFFTLMLSPAVFAVTSELQIIKYSEDLSKQFTIVICSDYTNARLNSRIQTASNDLNEIVAKIQKAYPSKTLTLSSLVTNS